MGRAGQTVNTLDQQVESEFVNIKAGYIRLWVGQAVSTLDQQVEAEFR